MPDPKQISGSYEELFERATRLMDAPDVPGAVAIFERLYSRLNKLSDVVLRRRPELSDLRLTVSDILAAIYRRYGKYDEALAIYQQLLETSSDEQDHVEWQHAIANLKIEMGNVDEGADALRALITAHPSDVKLRVSLGQGFFQKKEFEEAATTMEESLLMIEDDAEMLQFVRNALFVIYQKLKRFDDAEMMWQKIVQSAEKGKYNNNAIYELLLTSENYERLAQQLEKEKNPMIAGYYLGRLAFAQGQTDEAIKYWGNVAQKMPFDYEDGYDLWAEAALRADGDASMVAGAIYQLISTQRVTMRGALLLAVAEIRRNEPDAAHTVLKTFMKGLGAELNPEAARLEPEDWAIFSELLPADTDTEPFKPYFKSENTEA